jgi:hypothetical protein
LSTEENRKWGKKTITLPTGDDVDIRVVTEITFLDKVDSGQETRYTIYNRAGDANRDVHVDQVQDSSGANTDTLSVERIDMWRVKDTVDRAQETFITMDNKTGGDTVPPSFTTHIKTHTTNFVSQQNSQIFITTEWIDEFKVKDTVDQAQETHYFVTGNPQSDDDSTPGMDDEDLGGETSNIRTDPYQNIVDWRAPPADTGYEYRIEISFHVYINLHGGWTNPPPLEHLTYYDPSDPTQWPPCPAYTDWTTAHAWCDLFSTIEGYIPPEGSTNIPKTQQIMFLDNNSGVFPLELGLTICTNNAKVEAAGTSLTASAEGCSCSNPVWYVVQPLAIGVYQDVGGVVVLGSYTYDATAATITVPAPPPPPGGKQQPPTVYTFDHVESIGGTVGVLEATGGIVFILKDKSKPKL